MTVPVLVVVPFRNSWPYLAATLTSIAGQTYDLFRVVVVDDASDDGYTAFAASFAATQGWTFLRNPRSEKMPYNLRHALNQVDGDPEEVVVIVDGDDWLPGPDTLRRLAAPYEDPDVWLMWARYTRWPDPSFMPNPSSRYPDFVAEQGAYRRYQTACFNHPLTFRRHLFDQVTDVDLQDDDGEWVRASYDAAIMFPMLELAGPAHHRFIDDETYVYNEGNPASEAKTIPDENGRVHQILRRRPPKPRL